MHHYPETRTGHIKVVKKLARSFQTKDTLRRQLMLQVFMHFLYVVTTQIYWQGNLPVIDSALYKFFLCRRPVYRGCFFALGNEARYNSSTFFSKVSRFSGSQERKFFQFFFPLFQSLMTTGLPTLKVQASMTTYVELESRYNIPYSTPGYSSIHQKNIVVQNIFMYLESDHTYLYPNVRCTFWLHEIKIIR